MNVKERSISSSSSIKNSHNTHINTHTNSHTNKPKQIKYEKENIIKEVYYDNFLEEIKILSSLLDKYNYIAMDTEFPGFVYQSSSGGKDSYYRTIKTNVDKLKLIQVGITLRDFMGNPPPFSGTWQFNLKFNLNTEQHSNESIALLANSGINFDKLEHLGIPFDLFGEYLISSGLIVNEDLHWVCFHGIYDFAYFLKYSTNLLLPENEIEFFEELEIYFPNYYDIRYLVRFNEEFRGSLSKLGQELNVMRFGTTHQAGSDSLITSEIFFKLKKEYLTEENIMMDKNILFGIGLGSEDNDPINSYSNFYNQNHPNFNKNNQISNNSANNQNSNFSANFEYNNYYNQNMMNMQYNNYMRNSAAAGYYPSMNVYNNNNSYNNNNNNNNYNHINMSYQMNNSNGNNNNFQDDNLHFKKKINNISSSILKNLDD
jgi:CCR4-NOT transcription complex subunit 7/8